MKKGTAKWLVLGALLLLYGLYGLASGQIYKIPPIGRHGRIDDLGVTGDKLVYGALSYVALSVISFLQAVRNEKRTRRAKDRKTRKALSVVMWVLFAAALTLQAIS